MTFERQFFDKSQLNRDKLLTFGFQEDDQGYSYQQLIMDGDFLAQVRVSPTGQVTGQLIDQELDEPYLALQIPAATGTYVGQVREAYGQLLESIASQCFDETPFRNPQSNRLAHHLKATYQDQFDHPFEKYPQYASYRHPANNKWYALIFPLAGDKLDPTVFSAQDQLEVANIKVPKEKMAHLLDQAGIYPSYHMNKGSWVSVLLDGTLPDEQLFGLVEQSRRLVGPKSYHSSSGPDFWLIPANPKYYDIDAEFAQSDSILWTQKAAIRPGDWVLIYITAPVKAIRYACQVLEADIPNHAYRDQPGIKTLMKLQRQLVFDDALFSFERLKEADIKAIRGPRRVTKALLDQLQPYLPHGKS